MKFQRLCDIGRHEQAPGQPGHQADDRADTGRGVVTFVAVLVVVGILGIIRALDVRLLKAFLTLLAVVGGATFFIWVIAWYAETRLGKVFRDILTALMMFGGGKK